MDITPINDIVILIMFLYMLYHFSLRYKVSKPSIMYIPYHHPFESHQ